MNKSLKSILAILLVVTYGVVEFTNRIPMPDLWGYGIYIFEILWVTIIAIFFYPISLKIKKSSFLWVGLLLFPLGFATHATSNYLGFILPIDLATTETIFFLLIVAPILEEFVFRGGMWRLLEVLRVPQAGTLILTSLVFSFAHYQAVDRVPIEMKDFILYQTAYTFFLALLCGILRIKAGLVAAVLGHFLFNLGFYLGR